MYIGKIFRARMLPVLLCFWLCSLSLATPEGE